MMIRRIYLITLALALAFGIAVCDGLRIRDKASVIAGRYQEAAAIAKADAKLKDALIAKQNTIIGQKNKEIAEKNEVIGQKTNAIGQKDKELDKIRGTWSTLSADCQTRLRELDTTWAQKFSLSEAIVAEKDKVISAWAAKYAAQVIISDAWKQKYESEGHLRTISEQGWKLANRKLKTRSIIGNIKTGAIIAAAGYIGLNMLTKGK
jgi:hypothetical protein